MEKSRMSIFRSPFRSTRSTMAAGTGEGVGFIGGRGGCTAGEPVFPKFPDGGKEGVEVAGLLAVEVALNRGYASYTSSAVDEAYTILKNQSEPCAAELF